MLDSVVFRVDRHNFEIFGLNQSYPLVPINNGDFLVRYVSLPEGNKLAKVEPECLPHS